MQTNFGIYSCTERKKEREIERDREREREGDTEGEKRRERNIYDICIYTAV